jgi:hypothetical protein
MKTKKQKPENPPPQNETAEGTHRIEVGPDGIVRHVPKA